MSGGSASVSSDGAGGSTVTIDIPATEVQANRTLPSWFTKALAQVAGAAAATLSWLVCGPAVIAFGTAGIVTTGPGGLVLSAFGSSICAGLGSAMWTFVSSVVNQGFSGEPFTAEVWKGLLLASLTAFVAGFGVGLIASAAPAVYQLIKKLMSWLGTALTNIVGFIKPYLGGAWPNFINGIQRLLRRGQQQVADDLPLVELPGIPITGGRFIEEGFFENYGGAPVGAAGASPYCMDAYGSEGNPSAGQKVAINTCDQGASQLWSVYPDGVISAGGLCLDTKGGTSSLGTPLVDLERCDGSTNQTWSVVAATVVNKATSDCLDDPGGNTSAGTQLAIAPLQRLQGSAVAGADGRAVRH